MQRAQDVQRKIEETRAKIVEKQASLKPQVAQIVAEQSECPICYTNLISVEGPIKESDAMTIELDGGHRFCYDCTLSQLK